MALCVPCHAQGGLGLLLELGLFRGVQTAVAVFGLTMLHVAGLVGLLCLARPVVKPSKLPCSWPVNTGVYGTPVLRFTPRYVT